MSHREDFITLARAYVGTPYYHRGRNTSGLDCAGIIIVPATHLGLKIKDPNYSPEPDPLSLVRWFEINTDASEDLIPGDICLLKMTRVPQHFAIYTGPTIIHSVRGKGVREEPLGKYMRKLVSHRTLRWQLLH